ncbi:hypothetical protein PBAL39_06661 [Pedobacter sp. BAL39]|nr:hypothetical protein PBAL39_06661 [Pedobacter sp. BAL39]
MSACNPNTHNDASEGTKSAAKVTTAEGKFDLLKIKFNEPLEETLRNAGLGLSDGKPTVSTLMGYDVFVSSSSQLLHFDGQSLAGKADSSENQAVLHYTSDGKIISAFEVQLYTTEAVKKISTSLEKKFGKATFTHDSAKHPGVAIDMDGNMMDGPRREIRFQLWKNKDTGISYYLVQHSISGQLRYAEFNAINMKDQDAEKWIRFKAYHIYETSKL